MATTLAPVARAVAACLARRAEVQAGYVFGSVATGRARPDSDIDVAVLLSASVRPSQMLKHRLDLMADLGSALRRRDVDVVILNEAPPSSHTECFRAAAWSSSVPRPRGSASSYGRLRDISICCPCTKRTSATRRGAPGSGVPVVDRHVVLVRIGKIREYVALLRRIRKLANEATFVTDPLVYGNAERYLQLAIQAVLDVSNHIVADTDSRLPADNRDLFETLARRKVIPVRLARRLTATAGFRNILVHGYLEIDRHRVYQALGKDLADFDRFDRAVVKLL